MLRWTAVTRKLDQWSKFFISNKFNLKFEIFYQLNEFKLGQATGGLATI